LATAPFYVNNRDVIDDPLFLAAYRHNSAAISMEINSVLFLQ